MKISVKKEIAQKVLTVGLEHVNHRGGIGGVIDTYSNYFEEFNFVATYKPQKFKPMIVPYFLGSCVKLFWMLLTNRAIKIVHIHGAAKGSMARKYIAFFISKYFFGKKVIYHSHGSELKDFYFKSPQVVKRWIAHFFNNVDVIVCLSVQWEAFFNQNFKVKKVFVLENIVDRKELAANKVLKTPEGPVKFLFLGAIGNRKGIFDLLGVIAKNRDKYLGQIKLSVGGNGEVEKLNNFIKTNNLEDIVTFEGWVTGTKKDELLATNDIYFLPSYNEGLPLSILEAMSFKMPIVSTNVGGIAEVVKTDINGFLINPGDSQAIENSLNWFIDHKNEIAPMGSASLKMVEPYYSDNVIAKLSKLYQDILATI